MKRFTNAVRAIAFAIVFGLVFIHVQELVTPDYNFPAYNERLGNAVRGLYVEPKDTIQVLWLGASHMHNGVSPMAVYRESGVRSYNLSSPSQTVGLAYERLKAALERQSPKVAVVDTSFCFYSAGFNKNEVPWRMVIDSLHWSRLREKYVMMRGLTDAQGLSPFEALDGVFPLLRYHTHYLLERDDYRNDNDESLYITKGYDFSGRMKAVRDFDESILDHFSADEAARADSGVYSHKRLEKGLKYNFAYLEKMADLCRAHSCELVLTKIPVRGMPDSFQSYWSREKHDMIVEAAEKLGCRFVDLNYEDIGLDWNTDSKDAGRHLNTLGANKVSRFYADWLTEHCDLDAAVDRAVKDSWDRQLRVYEREEVFYGVKLETDPYRFLERLEAGDYTILTAKFGAKPCELPGDAIDALIALTGAQGAAEALGRRGTYLAVGSAGKAIDEMSDTETCTADGRLGDGKAYSVKSGGTDTSIRIGSLVFKGKQAGLYMVVYDNEMHCAIDCATLYGGDGALMISHSFSTGRQALRKAMVELEKVWLKER